MHEEVKGAVCGVPEKEPSHTCQPQRSSSTSGKSICLDLPLKLRKIQVVLWCEILNYCGEELW